MKTEQEQIEQIEKMLKYAVADYEHLKKKGVCYCYAETLIESGYGDISEYKAEIERLRQEVRDTDKMARNTIEQYRAKNEELENALKQSEDNYSRAFERLKAQQKEIKRLKDKIKQAKIDILNYLKDGYEDDISASNDCDMVVRVDDIDELIEEVQK